MSKRTLNLGKVVGRTPELRINGKIIQIKYDDETEWRDLAELAGGVNTVQTYRDLPTDAHEGDVCIVLEDGYGEDDWRQLSMNDVLVGRNPSQISFADTLDEIMSSSTLDRELILSGMCSDETGFTISDSKYIYFQFIFAKMEGIELTAILLNEYDENDDEESVSGYVITDDPETFLLLMAEIEGITFPKDRWIRFTMSYVPTEDGEDYQMVFDFTETESAPVITPCSSFDMYGLTYNTLNDSEFTGNIEYHYSLTDIKPKEAIYSLINANFADKQPKGIYIFTEGLWQREHQEDKIKEFYYESSNGNKSRESTDFTDFLPQGKEGEIVKLYIPEKERISYNYGPSYGQIHSYLNNTFRISSNNNDDTSAYIVSRYCLKNEISQEQLEKFDNKTIVLGASVGSEWCSGFISCIDGTILVNGSDSYGGFIYNSIPDNNFSFEKFKGAIRDEKFDVSVSFLLKDVGWYLYYNGFICRCDSTHITIKEMFFRDYSLSRNPNTSFLLKGITTKVPEILEVKEGVYLDDLFTSPSATYHTYDSVSYYTWDYETVFFAKYVTNEGWRMFTPEIEDWKIKQSHKHNNKYVLDAIKDSNQFIPNLNYNRAAGLSGNGISNYGSGLGLVFERDGEWSNSSGFYYNDAYCNNKLPDKEVEPHCMANALAFYSSYNSKVYYDWYIKDGVYEDISASYSYFDSEYYPNKQRRVLYAMRKDLPNVTDFSGDLLTGDPSNTSRRGFFKNWQGLTLPYFSTNSGKIFDGMFASNTHIKVLPFLNLYDFEYYTNSPPYGKYLDMSNAESMTYCFSGCSDLLAIGLIYFGHTSYPNNYLGVVMPSSKMIKAFHNCTSLEYLVIKGKIKVDSNDLSFIDSPNLRNDCAETILKALESNVGEDTQYTVYFHENVYNALTDSQKAIATNKNILLSYTK